MAGGIHKEATEEEIVDWFSSTPQEDRIPHLVDTIREWGWEDLSRLRLDERLSQEEIVELLEAVVELLEVTVYELREPVIHRLVMKNQTSTLISLLDRVTPQRLLSLFRLKGWEGLNVLGWALVWNRLPISAYVVEHLGVDELYNLLCERCRFDGGIQLHEAVRGNRSISEVLSLLKDETRVHQLLSIRGDEGQSVLSRSIYWGREESFQSIIRHYTGKQAELLELAAITDNKGHTSFHHAAGRKTSDYLTDLIKATCSLETREELANVLSRCNDSGGKKELGRRVEECHLDNEFIYNWASDSNHRYLLFDLPSIFVAYNISTREEGAESEAQSLITCLKEIGFDVEHSDSFTRYQLLKAIEDHQRKPASQNGQIVALMSHGSEGYIEDSEDVRIPLTEIEAKMCAATRSNTPKLLILQCCQDDGKPDLPTSDSQEKLERASSSQRSPSDARGRPPAQLHQSYSPRHPDFAALVSTGPGSKSERNQFIPKLAAAITSMATEASISRLMDSVKAQFPVNKLGQMPFSDGLKFEFCLKSVLPIYLKNKKTHKRPVDSEPKTIQKRRKRRVQSKPLDSSVNKKRRR